MLDPRSVSFRSQHTHFQKPVFKWLSSDILRSSLWLLDVVDVNLVFILGHFFLLHILVDVVGSRLIRNFLELGRGSARNGSLKIKIVEQDLHFTYSCNNMLHCTTSFSSDIKVSQKVILRAVQCRKAIIQ